VAIGLALGFATTARAGWKQDGSLLSSFPEGVVASDGNGGVFGAAGGYPGQFSRLYHLISSGDTASGWVAGGLELTPGAVIIEHNSITPVGALPDGLGGSFILTAEQFPYQGSGGFLYPVNFHVHRRSASGGLVRGWPRDGARVATPWIDHLFELHRLPRMVPDERRRVLVAWLDGDPGRPNPRVVVQRVGPAGSVQWGVDGIAVRQGANACTIPAVVADGFGGALVFWGEWNSGGTSIRVRGQHVTARGELLWGAEGRAVSSGSFDRMADAIPADGGWLWASYGPAISATSDGHGGAILGCAGSQGADLNILAMRVTPRGLLPWGRDQVVSSATGEQSSVVCAPLRDGGAVFAWRDGRAGADVAVFAQRISPAGRMLWSRDGVAVTLGPGDRGPVAVTSDAHEGIYLVWADPREGGQVFGMRLLESGRRGAGWTENGVRVSRTAQASGASVGLQLIHGERGTTIAVWTDAREGSLAMLLTPAGPAASPRSTNLPAPPSQGTDASPAIPTIAFSLHGVYPNPARNIAVVRFALAAATPATLEVVDVAGRRVWSREVGEMGPGEHHVSLADGSRLAIGIYFVRLTQGAHVATARVTLLR
jgi:hypothetical protein